jgi:hypothetical protein
MRAVYKPFYLYGILSIVLIYLLLIFFHKPSPQEEVKKTLDQLSKIMVLPGEKPTIGTITDKNKVKTKPFFRLAENGDKIILFSQNKKIILFRPSTNKIINIELLIDDQNITQGTTVNTPYKIAIYNGTSTKGLASTTEQKLKDKLNNVEITLKDNAKKTYTETVVVDLKNNKSAAQMLAQLLQGKVGSLPAGEIMPKDVDFLIIVAK